MFITGSSATHHTGDLGHLLHCPCASEFSRRGRRDEKKAHIPCAGRIHSGSAPSHPGHTHRLSNVGTLSVWAARVVGESLMSRMCLWVPTPGSLGYTAHGKGVSSTFVPSHKCKTEEEPAAEER